MKTLILITWSLLCIIIGYFSNQKTPEIKIIKETETKFKYIKIVKDQVGLKRCYDSRLDIVVLMQEDNWMEIKAHDKCKEVSKQIKMSVDYYKNTILFNAGLKSIQVFYYRNFNTFSIGTGVSYPFSVYVSAGYNF